MEGNQMLAIDKSAVNLTHRDVPFFEELEKFAHFIKLAKPLLDFKVDDTCVDKMWYRASDDNTNKPTHFIKRIKVYQDGELLGGIATDRRHHRGDLELVYMVESFRIRKERGNSNGTFSKDIKVALRHAKKVFHSREDEELKDLIGNTVRNLVKQTFSSAKNQVRWMCQQEDELVFYAMLGHDAHLRGEDTVRLPSIPQTANDRDKWLEHCELLKSAGALEMAYDAKKGYAIKSNDDNSLVCYDLEVDAVVKYKSFDELPESIATKFAMFKVLKEDEPIAQFGCKYREGYFFIPSV
jgi:hypothetical protein